MNPLLPDGRRALGLTELAKSFWLNSRKHPAFGRARAVRFILTCGFATGTYNAFLLMDRYGFSSDEVGAQVSLSALVNIVLLAVACIGGFTALYLTLAVITRGTPVPATVTP